MKPNSRLKIIALGKNLFPSFDDSDLEGKRRVEISPGVLYNIQEISSRIGQQGGNALIIDYGHQGEKEDTLRGFRNHKLVSILEQPGDTDITARESFLLEIFIITIDFISMDLLFIHTIPFRGRDCFYKILSLIF